MVNKLESCGKEFLVRVIKVDAADHFFVIGVPNNGRPIRIGDTFTSRFDAPQSVNDILADLPRPAPTNQVKVELSVVSIDSMRQNIDELPHGVTGALKLAGAGMERITPNCFLMT